MTVDEVIVRLTALRDGVVGGGGLHVCVEVGLELYEPVVLVGMRDVVEVRGGDVLRWRLCDKRGDNKVIVLI